jgi:hypothetical protein
MNIHVFLENIQRICPGLSNVWTSIGHGRIRRLRPPADVCHSTRPSALADDHSDRWSATLSASRLSDEVADQQSEWLFTMLFTRADRLVEWPSVGGRPDAFDRRFSDTIFLKNVQSDNLEYVSHVRPIGHVHPSRPYRTSLPPCPSFMTILQLRCR